jgi:hypothetical protein
MDIYEAINEIRDYYKKEYKILDYSSTDYDFIFSILQKLDNKSWSEGYRNALEDNELQ